MTQEQVDELLQPRYKVIAAYPGISYEIGKILQCAESEHGDVNYYKQYPHLFKRLEWWEDREVSEMPEYLKDTSDGIVYKVEYRERGTNNIEYRIGISWISLHFGTHVKPATEQDYLNYKNNQ